MNKRRLHSELTRYLRTCSRKQMLIADLKYHNVAHIDNMLKVLDSIQAESEFENLELTELVAAVCYHDVVYLPGFTRNEDASAYALARDLRALAGVWLKNGLLLNESAEVMLNYGYVQNLIRSTTIECHLTDVSPAEADDSIEKRLLLDLDLSSLAEKYETSFIRNQVGIVLEHTEINEDLPENLDRLAKAQVAFLKRFLTKTHIFRTVNMNKRFENRARSNLDRFVTEVESRGTKWLLEWV